MRTLLSQQDAEQLLLSISMTQEIYSKNMKELEQEYKVCINSGECKLLMKMLKTLFLHKERRKASGKKETAKDKKHLELVKALLLPELSISLSQSLEAVENEVLARIRQGLPGGIQ